MKHTALTLLVLAVLAAASPSPARADDENYEINWFLLLNYGARTGELTPPFGTTGEDWLIGEERMRMDITAWSDSIEAEVKVKLDFYHDAIVDEFDIDLREAYLDYTIDRFDFRFGRQVITWGVGDLVFINDVWPKDWVSYFSGRPLEYLKTGVDGMRARYSGDAVSAEFVFLPTFEPDNLPGADRFSFYNPFVGLPTETLEPERSLENSEVALRVYGRMAGFDVSGYLYKGFWHEPAGMPNDFFAPSSLTMVYPELNVYGASAQGQVMSGILSLETGYYDSREDEDGLDPLVKNSEFRWLVGYSRQIATDTTLGVQYFRKEYMDYDNYLSTLPPGFAPSESYRDEVTVSLRKLAYSQRMTIYIFGYYSPVDADWYILPSVSYKFSDEMTFTVGGNFFGGDEPTTFLGQFDENDNIYMNFRYDF